MKKSSMLKKLFACVLTFALMLGNLCGVMAPAMAAMPVFGGIALKETDPSTVNGWKDLIDDLDTEYAGGIWTDKSVFESVDDYLAATDEDEVFDMELENPRDFLISLSAIASTKTIVGHSTLPTDTMFVLDVSGSMDDYSRDSRMVAAANKAIGDLLALNNYNRVGVVLYASDATLMLPLDRYTTTSTTEYNNQTIPQYIYLSSFSDHVSPASGLRNSEGQRPNTSREVDGGTYIQSGLQLARYQLTATNLDTVIAEGFQAGTTRTPIVVLMSDGAPTFATNSYTNVGSSNMGDGKSSSATGYTAFVTQLTAAYTKAKIAQKYGSETTPLFYTLGLGVGSDSVALSVMDPNNRSANSTANNLWSQFNSLSGYQTISVGSGKNVRKPTDGTLLTKNYVDQYFAASNSNDLSTAFQKIVDTIILQTTYYPTLVDGGDAAHSGYLEFRDYIGPNMEVKQVEGIQLHEYLYTGEAFAKLLATGMGTEQNPTEEGNELVHSLITRLGLGEVDDPNAVATARALLVEAWRAGQLAYSDYNGDVTWSNWIGWYADENDEYIGFWNGEGIDEEMKGEAEYAIKSYLMLGEVGHGHRATDMMYASIQVRSHLDDNGEVLEDVVFGRLPASLIPLVEYHVELNTSDPLTATEITLSREGTDSPIRLIYEVGLRSSLDILDLEGTATDELRTDENGNYVFYTNQWDETGINEGEVPSKLHNAYMNFFPSEENERFYYHEDTPIYRNENGRYVKYEGRTMPSANDGNTYYHQHISYTATSNGGSAERKVEYGAIPAAALASENLQRNNSGWVIKKGTLHLYEARAAVQKSENETETLSFSEYPVVHNDASMGYHLDSILGNNGVLTLDPPEAIKIAKTIDDTLTDNGQTYAFNIELTSGSHDGATLYLVTETDGVRSAWQEIDFDSEYTVNIAAGDCAWIAGLPEGNTYTVTEEDGEDYKVTSIMVDGQQADEAVITVRKNHVAEAVFTNSAVVTGDVIIGKQVESSYEPHMAEIFAFDFDFTLTGAEPNESYAAVLVKADGSSVDLDPIVADANGGATFEAALAHGQAIWLKELPEGAVVTATETLKPGFTSDQENNTVTANVDVGATVTCTLTNTYEAAPVSPTAVDVYAEKILNGRDWDEGDSFTFVLEKHVSDEEHREIGEITIDYSDEDKTADFQSNIGESYTKPGTYSYHVKEKLGDLPGVSYDTAVCYFDVVVKDNGEGQLYIDDVIGHQDVTVEYDEDSKTWDVTTQFVNEYRANGSVAVDLAVRKGMTDEANTGASLEGYQFELHQTGPDFEVDELTTPQPIGIVFTNAAGVGDFQDIVLDSEGSYYYMIREVDTCVAGVEYDQTEYRVQVDVASNAATSGLTANILVYCGDSTEPCHIDNVEYNPANGLVPTMEYEAQFTNVYTPEENATTTIAGEKELIGRDLEDGEFTFELYEADLEDGSYSVGDLIETVANVGTAFTFTELEYDETGYYHYAVKETVGELGGVTYDERTFFVTVQVTADLENAKLVVNSTNVVDEDGANAVLKFTNTYKASADEIVLEAQKTMTGRTLQAGMFQFELRNEEGEVLQSVANDAEGKVSFPMTFDKVGEYNYTIVERIPVSAVDNKLNGVTYDSAEYPVTVTVVDDLNGNLVASAGYNTPTVPVFENVYAPAPTTATIGGAKVLEGREQTEGDEFTFELYEADRNFVPTDSQPVTATTREEDGRFVFEFEEMTYTEAGGYRYIIKEKDTGDSQIDYDDTEFYALVNVSDNGSGQLVSNVTVGDAIDANGAISSTVSEIEFFNVFHHTPASLVISGNKTLTDLAWESGHVFTFELYEANGEFVIGEEQQPLSTAQNDPTAAGSEGAFAFDALELASEGTYYYVVKEQMPEGVDAQYRDPATGIVYDHRAANITVTVEEDPDNPTGLKATYTVTGLEGENLEFVNRYTTEGSVLATISGKKVMEGRDIHGDDNFQFVLKKGNDVVETVTANGDGTSPEAAFSFQALSFDAVGEYTYTVEEVQGEVAGVTYSTEVATVTVEVTSDDGKLLDPVVSYKMAGEAVNEMVFTNIYEAGESEEIVLEGTKTLSGGILSDNQFTFELYEASADDDGVITIGQKLQDVQNTGSAFAFEGLTYQQEGTYYYVIKEQAGSAEGVTYDENEFCIKVVVEDEGIGTLIAFVDGITSTNPVEGTGVVFTNVFTPDAIPLSFTGTKNLDGRDLTDGEFTFELYQTESDHAVAEGAAPVDTAVNEGNTFTLAAEDLPAVGVYHYVVKEAAGSAEHVTYDATVYNITVTVSNNGGVLEKDVVYKVGGEEKAELVFNNTYSKPDPQPDPLDIPLYVQKIMRGNYTKEGFQFELVADDGKVIDTVSSDKTGAATLHVGTFAKADAGTTLNFILREVNTKIPGMLYSSREYKVQISIYYDSTNNRMLYQLSKDGAVVDSAEPFAFTNVYAPGGGYTPPTGPSVTPDTGDEGFAQWIVMMAVGSIGFAATLLGMFRKKRKA